MKKIFFLTVLASLATLFSCEKDGASNGKGEHESKLVVSTADFNVEGESDIDTRSTHLWVTEGKVHTIKFGWENGDQIVVYPETEVPGSVISFNTYALSLAQGNSAVFRGEGFDLKRGKNYYSFYPASALQVVNDKTNIPLSYENQRQVENGKEGTLQGTAHLSQYDYQVAFSKCETDGVVNFNFKHLGAVCRVRLAFSAFSSEKEKTFTKFEIIDSENYNFQMMRYLDLTDDQADLADYAPSLDYTKPVPQDGGKAYSIALHLGPQDGSGITVDPSAGELLVLYMMLPSSEELKGRQLYGVLTDKGGAKYYAALNGLSITAGSYITYGKQTAPSGRLNVTLKVDKLWQFGNTTPDTRAGDPGVNDKFDKPTHVKIYTFVDNLYKSVTELNDINPAQWVEDGEYLKYNGTIPPIDFGTGTDLNVYIWASNENLSVTPDLSVSSSTTTDINGMTVTTTNTQSLLKNTYSTTGQATDANPVIAATLYHVGAKLDLQWNSTTKLSGTVSVNDLPTSGLKLFAPTEQATGTGWSPSIDINEGNCWNGRAVFYVPQFSTPTYNVTTGTGHTGDIGFTAPSSNPNGWTSWFKSNITITH